MKARSKSIVCRLCLVADIQMFNLNNDNLRNCYYNLTGIMNLGMFPYVCYECLALMKRFGNFRSKCLTADQILKNVNINDVRKIDRESIGLTSTLILTNCITVTIKSPVNLDKSIITIDCSDEDEDIKSDKKLKKDVKELEVEFDEALEANDETLLTNIDEKPNAKDEKLDINIDFDLHYSNFDNNGDDSELYSNKNISVNTTAANLEDHSYSLNDKTKNEVVRTNHSYSLNDKTKNEVVRTNKRNKRNKLLNRRKRENYFDYLKGVATITLMSPEDARKALDARKQTDKYMKSQFKCDFCYRGYSLKSSLDKHMKIHNPEKGNFQCDYCSTTFKLRETLRKHLEFVHTCKFECKSCSHVCFDVLTAKRHANTHSASAVKSYNCDLCSSIFKSYQTLVAHKRSKHGFRCNTVPCAFCGNTFSADSGLKKHLLMKHDGETEEPNGPYCDVCDLRFATDVAWKRHFVLSDKHDDISIGCETCGEVFDTKEKLREHAREYKHFIHNLQRTKSPVACLYCTHVIAKKNEYESHMSEEHPNMPTMSYKKFSLYNRGNLICEICGKPFQNAWYLKRHHQEKHSDRPQFKCEICGKPFNSPRGSKLCAFSHASVDERTCKICGFVFKSKGPLRIHMLRVHLRVRRHKCTMCDMAFLTLCEVKYHAKTHFKENKQLNMASSSKTGGLAIQGSHVCEICGKQFKVPCLLKVHHQEKHSDGRPQFICKICGKPFKTLITCRIHKSTHASVDERTCTICGKVFISKKHLKTHMSRVHLGVRPHKCTICDKTFLNPCDVKYHIKYTHNKEPWPKPNRTRRQTKKTRKILES